MSDTSERNTGPRDDAAYSRRNPDPRQDHHHNGGDTRPNHPGKASAATPAAQQGDSQP